VGFLCEGFFVYLVGIFLSFEFFLVESFVLEVSALLVNVFIRDYV